MKFKKRIYAKIYIIFLKIKNRFKYTNITFESYDILHELPENTYAVIEMVLCDESKKLFDEILDVEILKFIESNKLKNENKNLGIL